MISNTTTRQGIFSPLIDYRRGVDARLPYHWQRAGFSPISQSQALRRIESFVDVVVQSDAPGFKISTLLGGGIRARPTVVGRGLLSVLPLLGLFDSYHYYSEAPYAFLDACWLMECVHRVDLQAVGLNPQFAILYYPELLNELVEKVRMSTRLEWFKRGIAGRRQESKERAARINQYMAMILHRYAKVVHIRLDFGYPEGIREVVTIDRVYSDLEGFLYLKEFHPYFNHLKGYVWAVEDGVIKGPHIHLILLFDGSQVREDITLGEMIRCNLWDKRITAGDGSSWNSNINKEKFSDVGVGVIHRDDTLACQNAIYYATYLAKDPHHPKAKDSQYLRIKPAGADAFGMGELSAERSPAGRPPSTPIPWVPSDMLGIRWSYPNR